MFPLSTILFCYSASSPISSDTKEASELRKIEMNKAQNVINSNICEKTPDTLSSKSCSGEPGVFQDSARPNDPSLEKRTVIEDSRIDTATAAKPKESDVMKLNKKKNNLVQNLLSFCRKLSFRKNGAYSPKRNCGASQIVFDENQQKSRNEDEYSSSKAESTIHTPNESTTYSELAVVPNNFFCANPTQNYDHAPISKVPPPKPPRLHQKTVDNRTLHISRSASLSCSNPQQNLQRNVVYRSDFANKEAKKTIADHTKDKKATGTKNPKI